ncbi:MAG: methylmalonyl-CoA mutase family protein, partial [Chitinophagaceae bacterium]
YQKNIEAGDAIIVGVNQFVNEEKTTVEPFSINDAIRLQQIEQLQALKATRNKAIVTSCLQAIHDAAINNQNLMPVVIEAVENYCTLGEISNELRKVFGEFKG